jgi:hypothetical protein
VSISHGAVYSLQSAGFLNLLSHEIQLRIGIIKMRDILIQASYWEIGEKHQKNYKINNLIWNPPKYLYEPIF